MKKLAYLFAAIFFSLTFSAACSGQKDNGTADGSTNTDDVSNDASTASTGLPDKEDISVAELKTLMASNNEIMILDVRTPEETANGMIEGAGSLNFFSDDFAAQVEKLDKSKTWAVYCAVGGRSSKAANLMREKGFSRVYNVAGGYTAWSQAGN